MKTDKQRLIKSFARAKETYNKQAFIQKKAAARLLELLLPHLPKKKQTVLEIGAGTGILTKKLLASLPQVRLLHLNDIVVDYWPTLQAELDFAGELDFIGGDIEKIDIAPIYSLIISSSTLHWLHDFSAFRQKMAKCMNSGAMLAFSLYGPDNLKEIKELTGRGLSYKGLPEICSDLAKDFTILVAEQSLEQCFFPSLQDLLLHLRHTGVNNLSGKKWSRKEVKRFTVEYEKMFTFPRGVRLSYNPLYLVATKK